MTQENKSKTINHKCYDFIIHMVLQQHPYDSKLFKDQIIRKCHRYIRTKMPLFIINCIILK